MNENLSLGRIAAIHVGLNWSLLVVAALKIPAHLRSHSSWSARPADH